MTFIDQNSYRASTKFSPLAPIFVAVDTFQKGKFDFSDLDLITDRNNLRKLLRWIDGRQSAEDFRIDIELAENTVLFTRCDPNDAEIITGFRGFGHNYEKDATRLPRGCEKATGYHRINQQNFGGLKVLLRFEVDACTQPAHPDADDLADAFSNFGVQSSSENATLSLPGLTVIRTSPYALVPQSHLIEMKTRVSHKELDWNDTYPQLYISQTTHLYLAKHTKGTFAAPQKYALSGMKDHASSAQASMGKLKALLEEVLDVVRTTEPSIKLALISKAGKLELYKRKEGTGRPSVGKEILGKFKKVSVAVE
jgi:hypothetical protein